MHNTIRWMWLRLALSTGLAAAAVGVTAAHAHPILAGFQLGNHCEPVVHDQ